MAQEPGMISAPRAHAFTRTAFRRTHLLLLPLILLGCGRDRFPNYPATYHEFAYVSNGASNTVTVLDLVNLRQDRVLQVGREPTGLAANPVRDEVYAVNTGSDSVSVIDATTNRVAATIGVQRTPYAIAIAPDGKRGYVANSASNTVSVLDFDTRRQIGVAATGEGPGMAKVSPDNRTLVVSNRIAGSLSTDVVIVANSASDPTSGAKAFVACSATHKVMVVWLAASPDSWRGKQDASLQHDQMLCLLDVGNTPTHLAAQPNGYEVFSTNFGSDSISEINTWTNEVIGTYPIGTKPANAVISGDNSSLWVTNFGADSAAMYSIDDGRVEASVHTGVHPDTVAFSADEHLLLIADSGSADVAVIRMQSKDGPTLFTMLPSGGHANDIVVKAFHSKL
jgi:YVTN family beta-propeller protein